VAIQAVEVGKMYRLGERESYTALRDVLANLVRGALGRGRGASARAERPILWSLRNVSFNVEQ